MSSDPADEKGRSRPQGLPNGRQGGSVVLRACRAVSAGAALMLLVSGCASGPREVLVPTRVPCVDRSQIPSQTPPTGELPPDARQSALILAATILALRGENRTLRALLEPCAR